MSKASNEEEDSDSDELHVELLFFECGDGIKECGVGRGEGRSGRVRLRPACVFTRTVKQFSRAFRKRVVVMFTTAPVNKHFLKLGLAADDFVQSNKGITSSRRYGEDSLCSKLAVEKISMA
jgi:hypothetical protein